MAEPYRVLVVEDDYRLAEIITDFLRLSGPFNVNRADSIQSLWVKFKTGSYDIILMDNQLPDGTGIQALEELRGQGYNVPLIMITGQGDERLAVRAMQLGAVDYLVKGTHFLSVLPSLIEKAVKNYRLQQSVQQSLEQIRYQALLLNNVRDAVVVWNVNGEITYWNPAAQKLFGWSPPERLGRSVNDCYLGAFSPPVIPPPREGTSGHEIERLCKTKDGRTIWVSSRVSSLYDPGSQAAGGLLGYMDVIRDITARKRAEQALRDSEERYRAVSELVTDFVYAFRMLPDGSIALEWITDAFTRITGYTPDEVVWKFITPSLIHPKDQSIYRRIASTLIKGESDVRELRILTRRGEVRWIRNYAQPVFDQKGRLVRIYGASKDITEQKQMESHLRSAQKRLTQSARMAAIGELASSVAHHINNPLTTIIAEAQILLLQLVPDTPQRESAEAIEQAGWRVQQTVQQLIEYSRPGSSTIERLSINETVHSALTLVGDYLTSWGVTLDIRLAEDLPAVRGNARQLCDLWVTLLMLVRNAAADGQLHTIRIRSQYAEDHHIVVEIADDGPPNPAIDMQNNSELNFSQLLGEHGTGIELNICQEIVRQHNSSIVVESMPERGNVYRLSFPVEAEYEISQCASH